MSDTQCPVQIPSVDGELIQCINYPMGNAVLCAEDARTLGVIRWAVLNDDDVREALVGGNITIEIDDAPILSDEAIAELAKKATELDTKKVETSKRSAGKKGA